MGIGLHAPSFHLINVPQETMSGWETDRHDTMADGEAVSLPHPRDPKAKELSVWSVVPLGVLLGGWRTENKKTCHCPSRTCFSWTHSLSGGAPFEGLFVSLAILEALRAEPCLLGSCLPPS